MRARMLLGFSILISSKAMAWGERGHDAVSRVATRILAESEEADAQKLGSFLQRKENMLGHLANVPDIVWRNASKEMDDLTAPAHFIDMEFFLAPGPLPKPEELPADIKSLLAAMGRNCSQGKTFACVPGESDVKRIEKAGHAPFRIQTLVEDLTKTFRDIKSLENSLGKTGKDNGDPQTELVQKAILHAGILSHYVGDLANPHHTSADYDGWDTDQGGLHGYFESEVVDSYPLELEAHVLDEALRHPTMEKKFANYAKDPLKKAWVLALDSHQQLDTLRELDRKYSLLEKSVKGERDSRKKAKRKDVKETRNKYRNFIIIRLATGADALAQFWLQAWRDGGSPDLSFYRSYHYDVKPDLIPFRYLPERRK